MISLSCTSPDGSYFGCSAVPYPSPLYNQYFLQVFPVPSFADDSSGALPESDRIQRMKDRVTQMEKDLRSTYALAAIINKKSEIAADVERYVLSELHKATESLNCKFPDPFACLLATSCLSLY
jgi:hypothetical protein